MGLKEWIIPQDHKYFDLLDAICANNVEAAEHLKLLLANPREHTGERRAIKDLEHKGDDYVHEMYQLLNKSFITPFDHGDITQLLSGLDDFLDFIDASANRMRLYELTETTEGMRAMGDLIGRQAAELKKAVTALRHMERPEDISRACIEIHSLENAADALLNEALATLFKGKDAILLLKMKEVYEHLEIATDKAEDAANIINDLVVKNA